MDSILSKNESQDDMKHLEPSISFSKLLDSKEFMCHSLENKLSILSFMFDQETFSNQVFTESKSNIRKFTTFILETFTIPKFQKLEYGSCEDLDYKDSIKSSVVSLKLLIKLFSVKNIDYQNKLTYLQPLIISALIICLEHSSEQLWTSPETIKLSKKLFTIITSFITDLKSFIIKESASSKHDYVYEDILILMKDRLDKNVWKLSPSYPVVFWKLLSHLQSDLNLEYLLPLTLSMLSDFEVHYKLLGFKCLNHILKHGSKSHIRMHDRVLVIFDLLLRQFHCQEGEVLEKLFECLPQVLLILERKPANERLGERSKTDDAFETYLQCMNLENKTPLQRIYSRQLSPFILQMSITSVKHMTAIIRIIGVYLEYYDPEDEEIRVSCMQGLLQLMRQAWTRLKGHGLEITEMLFRLLHAISHHNYSASQQAKETLLTLIKQSFIVLHQFCATDLQECFDAVLAMQTYSKTFQNNVQSIADSFSRL